MLDLTTYSPKKLVDVFEVIRENQHCFFAEILCGDFNVHCSPHIEPDLFSLKDDTSYRLPPPNLEPNNYQTIFSLRRETIRTLIVLEIENFFEPERS